jgi:osmotically-inducible protein OsmY
VLDALWSDRLLGPREIEVRETGPGQVSLSGELDNWEEVGRAVALAERAKGVKQVESKMTIAPRPPKRRSTD